MDRIVTQPLIRRMNGFVYKLLNKLLNRHVAGRAWSRPVLLLTASLCAQISHANMRCNEDIVDRGLTFIEVVERCGEPDAEYSRLNYFVPGVYSSVEEWFYELGNSKFRRLLTFENGRLRNVELRPKPKTSIRSLDRGH